MKRKKITKYNVGGNTGGAAAIGASALSGVLGGASMGPLGMLGGGLIGAYNAYAGQKAEQDNLKRMEDDAARAEELRLAEEKRNKFQLNQQILNQYPVEGTYTPRFDGGGMTKTSESKGGDDTIRDGFHKALKLDTRAGMMALNHPEFAEMFNAMTPEELEMLAAKKAEITAQAEGLRGKGIGPALEMFTDLDLSFIKPLRERTGVSKSELTDWTLDQLGVEGAARQGAKAAAFFKTYEHGGPTHPQTYNAEPQPNMPIGRELRHERGMPYYVPVDAPNGSIRQWEPSMMDYLSEAFSNTFDPIRAIGSADMQQRGDAAIAEDGYMGMYGRGVMNDRDRMYANDKNDILPDWVYSLAGVQPKMEGGGSTEGEIRPMPDGINMTTGLSGASNPHEAMIRPDGGMENLLEFIDPTGFSSWDDAYRAYQGMKRDGRYLPNFGEAADMFGAIPLVGKVGKGAKLGAQLLGVAGRGVNLFDTAQDLYSENLAMGGMTGPRYEAEGGEMIQYQPGDRPAVYGTGGVTMKTGTEGEITGPSHAQGGVDMSDEKGARIYSNKLTVDPELMARLSKL